MSNAGNICWYLEKGGMIFWTMVKGGNGAKKNHCSTQSGRLDRLHIGWMTSAEGRCIEEKPHTASVL